MPLKPNAEQELHRIWQQLLGRETINRHDNFFALGGDSILVIQMIAKASQIGLHFSPKQVFQHQTIAALAAIATPTEAITAPQQILTGTVPLTPIQHWFFEQNFAEMHHWNQAVLLEVRQPVGREWLEQALQQLLNYHDSLRLRFQRTETGWHQEYAAASIAPLHWIDLSQLSEPQQTQIIEMTATVLQASLDLSTLPLRIAFFDRGQRSGRLLLILHHLVVDGISWRILLSDLHHLCQRLSQGKPAELPPKTSAFRQWAEALHSYQPSADELNYWHTQPDTPLPIDNPCHDISAHNRVADLETVSVALSIADTQALLQTAPAAYQTQINDLLLTAFVQAFSTWTGSATLLIELESHGREDLFSNIDLSRTVGWFTNAEIAGFDEATGRLQILLSAPEASFVLPIINDIIEEGEQSFDFRLAEGEGYTVDPNQNATVLTITDDNGGPGVGPKVGLSVDKTTLVEGDQLTVTFTVDGEIPPEGLQVLVQSPVMAALGQFDLADLSKIQTTGIKGEPTVGDGAGSSFFVTITEPTATISLSVLDDIEAEEPLELPFSLANGELYEVDPEASSVTLNVADEGEVGIGPTVSLAVDKTELAEGEAFTVSFTVDGEIPEGGLPVLVQGAEFASLTEFDIAGIDPTTDITGTNGEFPVPGDDRASFVITITEPQASITLSTFDDGPNEGAEELTFSLPDGEDYNVNPEASEVTLTIDDGGTPSPEPSPSPSPSPEPSPSPSPSPSPAPSPALIGLLLCV
ncbi:condensation domain-containing protein [Leptolyngbya sp. 7M]|uniref:condensation domain-containing protein n=1 Tax=Leptolyngbya sp. 7M TaxID=2812896 RepID=UPI001B8B2F4F|nr:condensation domain-containing protein [Leptolyngbya sp. 7M]QYO64911.1 hypothetical protein JVX88_36150 [Leptolyngbya sp. 7M]